MTLPDSTPSASYISLSNSASSRSADPSKKLLILDLNGTLLFRPKSKFKFQKGGGKRPIIHIRPYMRTFCSYLFDESVRLWLDVMVWSSAQPQNVDIMVTKCFKENKSDLKAIWARDTMGLDRKSYDRKVQTIKDLEKPWAKLGLPFVHSATSTLLMDDSPLKTRLQPYNHLCVPEYTQSMWQQDRHVHKQKSSSTLQYDRTLLAAIGILEELKYQTNVAGWLRSGGLWADHDAFSKEETSPGVDRDNSSEPKPLWFEHNPCFDRWVAKGVEAVTHLESKITVDPGFRSY